MLSNIDQNWSSMADEDSECFGWVKYKDHFAINVNYLTTETLVYETARFYEDL